MARAIVFPDDDGNPDPSDPAEQGKHGDRDLPPPDDYGEWPPREPDDDEAAHQSER